LFLFCKMSDHENDDDEIVQDILDDDEDMEKVYWSFILIFTNLACFYTSTNPN
jgi:hypothetical protein